MDPGPRRRRRQVPGIPRARGDGPVPGGRITSQLSDSPRSRGWTRTSNQPLPTVSGFPALAGMDRWRSTPRGRGARIPRARGDGPSGGSFSPASIRDSPRSRGWTVGDRPPALGGGGFPALAGMDPRPTSDSRWRSRIPRARGDGPAVEGGRAHVGRDSPRSRGWTREADVRTASAPGFPALAGMDPRSSPRAARGRWIPRARGDGPRSRLVACPSSSDSPRSRGWTAA